MDDLLEFLSPPVKRGVSGTPGVFSGVVEDKRFAYDSFTYRRSYPKDSTDFGQREFRPNTLKKSRPFEELYTRKRSSHEVTVLKKSDCLDITQRKRRRSKKIQTSTSNLENSIDKNNIYLLIARKQNEKIYQIATSSNTLLKKQTSFHENENREDLKLLIRSLDMDKSRLRDHQLRFRGSNTSLMNEVYGFESPHPKFADEFELKHAHESTQKCCDCERRKNADRKDFLQDIGPIKLHLPNSPNCRLESFSLNSPQNHLQIHGKIGLDHNDQYVLKCAATLDDKPIRTNCDNQGFVFPNVLQANHGRLSNSNRQMSRDVPVQVVCPAFEECCKRNESRGIQVDSKYFSNFQDESTQYSNMNLSSDTNAENTPNDNVNTNPKSPLVVISVYHNKNAIVQENVLSENLEATMASKTIKQSKGKVTATNSARSKSPSSKVFNKSSNKSIKNNSAKSSRSPSPAPKRKTGNQTRESNNSNSSASKSRSPSPSRKNTQSARKTSNERNSNNCCTNCDQCKEYKSKGTASKTNIDKKNSQKTEASTKVTKQQRSFQMKQQTTVQQVTTSKKQNTNSNSQNRQQSPAPIGKQHGSSPTANLRQQSPNKTKTTLRQTQGKKLKASFGKTSQRDPYGFNVKDENFDDGAPPARYLYAKRDTITCPTIAHSKHLSNILPAKSAECICETNANNFPQRDMVKKELVDSYMKLYDAQACKPCFTENTAKKPSEIMISINPGNEQLDLCVKKDEHKKELSINRTRILSFEEAGGRRQPCTVDTCENLRKLNAEANKHRDDKSSPYFEFSNEKDPNKHYPGDRCPLNDPSERDKEIRHLLGVDLRKTDRMVQVDNKHKAQKVQEFKYYNRPPPATFSWILAQGENVQKKTPESVNLQTPKNLFESIQCSQKQYEITQVQSARQNHNTPSPYPSLNSCPPRRKLKTKSITLSRKEYIKVKQTIQHTLAKRPKGRNWKLQRKTFSDISISEIKSKPKQPELPKYCDKEIQTDIKVKRKHSSKAATKNSASNDKKVQANVKIAESKNKKSKRDTNKEDKSLLEHKDSKMLVLFRAKETKRNRKDGTPSTRRKLEKEANYHRIEKELHSNHAGYCLPRKVMSSLEVRYASVAFMKKITISSMVVHGSRARTNIETNIGDSPRPLGPKMGSSILTLFKCAHNRKSVTPNLGTSAVSLYPEGGSDCTNLRSVRDKQSEKTRKPFLRRLMSCLVMKAKSNQNRMRMQSAITTQAQSSWDSYRISSSFAGMEVTSSMYDTSVSFYSSHHGINPINSKIKRSFFSSVREMLTKKS